MVVNLHRNTVNSFNARRPYPREFQQAEGYDLLGMKREAKMLLEEIPEESEDYIEARKLLALVVTNSPECAEVAQWGCALIEKHPDDMGLALKVAACLVNAGRANEAMELSRKWFPKMSSPIQLLNYAQTAAITGCDCEVAATLEELLWIGPRYFIQSMLDFKTRRFWERALALPLEERVMIRLASPIFADFCHLLNVDRLPEVSLDKLSLTDLPENARPWMAVESGFFKLKLNAPAEISGSYMKWQKVEIKNSLSLIEKVLEKSRARLLDFQFSYASKTAAQGNIFAARSHMLYELAFRPERLDEYSNAMGALGLQYVLRDLARLPDLGLLNAIRWEIPRLLFFQKSDDALALYESLPTEIEQTVLGKILYAGICGETGRIEEQRALWFEIMKMWPEDSAAYYNLIHSAIRTGNWSEARKIRGVCPPSFRFVTRLRAIDACIQAERLVSRISETLRLFYGEPGVGGCVEADY